MVQYFNNRVVEALDECAPWKNTKNTEEVQIWNLK